MRRLIDYPALWSLVVRFGTAAVVAGCAATVLESTVIPLRAERLPFALCLLGSALVIALAYPCARVPSPTAFVGLLAGLALALRVGWIFAFPNHQISDFAIYHELAAALAGGHGYVITGPVGIEDLRYYILADPPLPYATAFRPPGAPLWGAALYLAFGVNPRWFQLSNAVLGALTAVAIYFCFPSEARRGAGRAAAFLWAIYPPSIAASSLWCTEVLHTFCVCVIALILELERRTGHPLWWAAGLGVVVAFAALVRVGLLPLALATLAVVLWMPRPDAVRVAVVFMVFVALGSSPWIARNWLTFGRLGITPTAEGEVFGRHTRELVPAEPQRATADRYERWRKTSDEFDKAREGYRLGRQHLLAFARSGPRHIAAMTRQRFSVVFSHDSELLYWVTVRSHASVSRPDAPPVMSTRLYTWLERIFNAYYFALLVLAVVGALRRRSGHLAAGSAGILLWWMVFVIGVVSVVPLGLLSRYHFGLMPFVCMLAGIGLDGLAGRVHRGIPGRVDSERA